MALDPDTFDALIDAIRRFVAERLRPLEAAVEAADAIPDAVVDDLVIHGSPESCRDQVQAYADAGVKTPVMALLPTPDGPANLNLLRDLGPVA